MPKIISNILPKKLNKEIIKILTNTKGWYFGNDTNLPLHIRLEEGKDQGLSLVTFDEKLNNIIPQKNFDLLNMCANFIAHIVCDRENITKWSIKRVNYNFYHTKSKGSEHVDSETPNCVSILYNFNTNDGYTEILNEKYKSNESEAILFNSNLLHKGIGDEKNLRYNLNILIRYESDT